MTLVAINLYLCTVSRLHLGHGLLVSECPSLDAPEFGRVQTAYGTAYGETAGYTCDKGYMIYGVSSRTCQHSAIWTATAPTCIILGNTSKNIYSLATTKTFVCQTIFRADFYDIIIFLNVLRLVS